MLRIYFFLFCSIFSFSAIADDGIWLLVDTSAQTLEIKKGEKTLEKINDIAIGQAGAGYKTHRGDNITPFGSYRIGWIGEKSSFRRFFGLNYPSMEDAEKAFRERRIDGETYSKIVNAHRYRQVPPQNTPLGGRIGIHGLGRADAKIHQKMNWTHGCIALTNGQIDHLSHWVDTGTIVKIK